MTEQNQTKLGKTLWAIADQLRGAMDADDFRDYMLSFLFLRYLSTTTRQRPKGAGQRLPRTDRQFGIDPLAALVRGQPGRCARV
jgi:Type I restriction-modification system methyltransferase subunit